MERVAGIEPASQPWEGRVLPLNYTRRYKLLDYFSILGCHTADVAQNTLFYPLWTQEKRFAKFFWLLFA